MAVMGCIQMAIISSISGTAIAQSVGMVFLPILLALAATVARADCEVQPCVSLAPIIERFEKAAEAADERYLFKLEPRLRAHEDLPELLVVGSGLPHEIESAQRFARYFRRESGYTTVLLASRNGIDTPAFDGVILDRNRHIIANFSLKSPRFEAPGLLFTRIHDGFVKMTKYSEARRWVRAAIRALNHRALMHEEELPTSYDLGDHQDFVRFVRITARFADLIPVLLAPSRPYWLLADTTDNLVTNDELTHAIDESTEAHRRKLVVLTESRVLIVENYQLSVKPVTNCYNAIKHAF